MAIVKKLDVIYILSEKSSGSSFLFRSLHDALSVKSYPRTHHYESETLYWTKAASILKKPQLEMLASAVPYEEDRAREEIKTFLANNLTTAFIYETDEEMVFNGWFELIKQFGPVFIEKSPHHLLQWEALELMIEFERRFCEQISCHYICIVRNPKDIFLSQFRRWNVPPERLETQWLITHINWQRFKGLPSVSNKILIKYEDLISNTKYVVERVCEEFGVQAHFHGKESAKVSKSARYNIFFGYQFSSSAINAAALQGYSKDEVQGEFSFRWPLYRVYISFFYSPAKSIFYKIKRVLQ